MSRNISRYPGGKNDSTCKLFVGHIPKGMSEEYVTNFLSHYAPIRSFCFIRDPSSNVSKGCAFITVDNAEIADNLINQLNGRVRLGNHPLCLVISYAKNSHQKSPSDRRQTHFSNAPSVPPSHSFHSHLRGSPEDIPEPISQTDLLTHFPHIVIENEPLDQIIRAAKSQPVSRDALAHPSAFLSDIFFSMLSESISTILASQNAQTTQSTQSLQSSQPLHPSHHVNTSNMKSSIHAAPRVCSAEPMLDDTPSNQTNPLLYTSVLPSRSPALCNPPHIRSVSPLPLSGLRAVRRSDSPVQSADDWSSFSRRRLYVPSDSVVSSDSMAERLQVGNAEEVSANDDNPSFPLPNEKEAPVEKKKLPRSKRFLENLKPQMEGPVGANLFIYDIPLHFTEKDLQQLFDSFGNVLSAKIYIDRKTGKSRGFGFVSFDSVESADNAIKEMNGYEIDSKVLQVQKKIVKEKTG